MNSTINPEIEGLKIKIRDAQETAVSELVSGLEEIDRDLGLEESAKYARNQIAVYDRLAAVKIHLDKMETVLRDLDSNWLGGGIFFNEPDEESSDATKVFTAKELLEMDAEVDSQKVEKSNDGRSVIEIKITDGMIRQNLLTFTRAIKKRQLKIGQRIVLEHGTGKIDSKIVSPGNKLRERGDVGRLYKELHASQDDTLILTPVGARDENRWQVSLRPSVNISIDDLMALPPSVGSVRKQVSKEIPTQF